MRVGYLRISDKGQTDNVTVLILHLQRRMLASIKDESFETSVINSAAYKSAAEAVSKTANLLSNSVGSIS